MEVRNSRAVNANFLGSNVGSRRAVSDNNNMPHKVQNIKLEKVNRENNVFSADLMTYKKFIRMITIGIS